MHKKVKPDETVRSYIGQFPHCDQRVLHAPKECEYCDRHPEWQALRIAWGIAFTGYEPDGKELPCPAMHARGATINAWHGNVAVPEPAASTAGAVIETDDPKGRKLRPGETVRIVRLSAEDAVI